MAVKDLANGISALDENLLKLPLYTLKYKEVSKRIHRRNSKKKEANPSFIITFFRISILYRSQIPSNIIPHKYENT